MSRVDEKRVLCRDAIHTVSFFLRAPRRTNAFAISSICQNALRLGRQSHEHPQNMRSDGHLRRRVRASVVGPNPPITRSFLVFLDGVWLPSRNCRSKFWASCNPSIVFCNWSNCSAIGFVTAPLLVTTSYLSAASVAMANGTLSSASSGVSIVVTSAAAAGVLCGNVLVNSGGCAVAFAGDGPAPLPRLLPISD